MSKTLLPYRYDLTHPAAYRVIDGDTVEVSIDLVSRQPFEGIEDDDLGFTLQPSEVCIEIIKSLKKEALIPCGLPLKRAVRFAGIDVPPKSTDAGKAVAKVVELWLKHNPGFQVVSVKRDKFARRFIGYPIPAGAGLDAVACEQVAQQPSGALPRFLWENNLGHEYLGKKKRKWSPKRLAEISKKAGLIIKGATDPSDDFTLFYLTP